MREIDIMRAKAARLSDQRLEEEIRRLVAAIEHPDTQKRERARHIKRREVYLIESVVRATVRRQREAGVPMFANPPRNRGFVC